MVDYCPGCNRRETIIQMLVDGFRISQGLPGGAISALDLGFRNSPIPGKIMSEAEALRSWLDDYETIFTADGKPLPAVRESTTRIRAPTGSGRTKKKRKVSKYQREFGRQLKKLKKKHPRTSIGILMKKAHRATRKALR